MSTRAHRVSPRTSGDVDDGSPAAPHRLNSRERHSRGSVWGLFAVARVLIALAGSSTALGQCHYTYVEIPNPPGWRCRVWAINNAGWVTGRAYNFGDNKRAFRWTPAEGTRLLPLPPGYNDQEAYDINDAGHVVGYIRGPAGAHSFLWDGQQTTIIEHPAWATEIEAYGINNSDEIVGNINNSLTGPIHGFHWCAGVLTDLTDVLGAPRTRARAINDGGAIVGTITELIPGGSTTHAYVLDADGVHMLREPEGIVASEARAINNGGVVVGFCNRSTDPLTPEFGRIGAMWHDGVVDLVPPPEGTRDRFLTSVNNQRVATGYFEWNESTIFTYHDGIVLDVNSIVSPPPPPPGTIWAAFGINDSGDIAAWLDGGSALLVRSWRPGDLTGDCQVTMADLVLLLSQFGASGGAGSGDVDLDGDVDISDLALMLSNWGS